MGSFVLCSKRDRDMISDIQEGQGHQYNGLGCHLKERTFRFCSLWFVMRQLYEWTYCSYLDVLEGAKSLFAINLIVYFMQDKSPKFMLRRLSKFGCDENRYFSALIDHSNTLQASQLKMFSYGIPLPFAFPSSKLSPIFAAFVQQDLWQMNPAAPGESETRDSTLDARPRMPRNVRRVISTHQSVLTGQRCWCSYTGSTQPHPRLVPCTE